MFSALDNKQFLGVSAVSVVRSEAGIKRGLDNILYVDNIR